MNPIQCVPMTNPCLRQPQAAYAPIPQQPSYNAVKIDIHNPSVGANQASCQGPCTQQPLPYYTYPQAPIYDYPQCTQDAYYKPYQVQPQAQAIPPLYPYVTPTAVQQQPETPAIATPVVPTETTTVTQNTAPVSGKRPVPVVIEQLNVNYPASAIPQPKKDAEILKAPEVPAPVVTEQVSVNPKPETPEIKDPEPVNPQVDLNSFIAKLANPDFEIQAAAMEEIASMVKTSPDKATELVDTKIFDALANVANFDSTALAGPTQEQLALREKSLSGQKLTPAEEEIANKFAPKELADRNKSYALFTTAIMQKLYADEVARLSNQTVPLTELPGIATVVDNLKDNPNPLVRASAIDALSYIQNPAYKNDLATVFTVAKKDSDAGVAEAAKIALDKLNQI